MNYFFARILKRLGYLKNINTLIKYSINDSKINIPLINGLGYDNLNMSELWMCQMLEKILPFAHGTFIDVGVNVGQTLIKLKTINTEIDYVGFEPNPSCIYYTDILIKENKFQNCRLIPVGIFNQDTILKLDMYSEGDTDSAASLIKNFRPGEKVIKQLFVAVNRFENVNKILGISKIAVIKIDVEGAEAEVLESLKNVISVCRPFILIEILPSYNSDNYTRISRQEKIETLFDKLDYKIIRVIKKKNGESIEKLECIDSIGIHGNMDWCDYIIAPKEIYTSILFN